MSISLLPGNHATDFRDIPGQWVGNLYGGPEYSSKVQQRCRCLAVLSAAAERKVSVNDGQ